MKRIVIAVSGALVLAILVILLLAFANESGAPKFVPGAPATVTPWGPTWYAWHDDVPFRDGRLWLLVDDTNNVVSHIFLYDLNHRAILGELVNNGLHLPLLQNSDGSRLLVDGSPPGLVSALRTILTGAGKISPRIGAASSRLADSFWVVETQNNSAKRVVTRAVPGTWQPSPDFHYGFCMAAEKVRFLCDLETQHVTQPDVAGIPRGWWDTHTILLEVGTNSLGLFDVQSLQSRTLLGPDQIQAFLATNNLLNDASGVRAFANWNGREFDFYLGCASQMLTTRALKPQVGRSFLLKIDRNGPTLKLLSREFEFQPQGVLDATGTHYLYGGGLFGEVYLRDLLNDRVTTVVPPGKIGQFARARFFGDEVIYFRDGQIRRVKLDGTSDEPVLPELK